MSKMRETIVTNCEKSFLLKCLAEHTRLDGRSFDEFRNFEIEFGKDYGCCYVSLGKTKVLAQVSCEMQQPKSSRPSEGILNINIELNTIAAPHFEPGRQSDLSVQLNRLLEKCLKDSKAVDLESLCIKMNEKVWALRVDVNVLNHEGNILDCASVAALGALTHFRRPDVTSDGEEFIIHTYEQRDPIPIVVHHYPVCITYGIFNGGEYVLADPTLLEEGVADAFLSVALNAYRELCGLHLGGKAELATSVILQTTSKAGSRAADIVNQIKKAVEKDNISRQEKQILGFHNTINQTREIRVESLTTCLDQWNTATYKKRMKQNNQSKPIEILEDNVVQSLGKGSAALTPKQYGDVDKVWDADSEEDDQVEIIEVPEKKIDTVFLPDSDSEEEAVVVLNADKKTNKKKKS